MPCIRYFAATDGSPDGLAALEYLRSLLRQAPVRVLSMSGGLVGSWQGYAQLLSTRMLGDYVNVVCAPPTRWTWMQQILAPQKPPAPPLSISGPVEIYTKGVRNVLLAGAWPDSEPQRATARRYESIVLRREADLAAWTAAGCAPTVIPVPVADHDAFRFAVMG